MKNLPTFALILALGCSSNKPQPETASGISGPYPHENLAIYIVENPSAPEGEEFITLDQGMRDGAVVLTEKQDGAEVQELMIENKSDKPLFIQGGDVVKGGQQDRVISRDFVVPPKSGKLPVSSFCVEQGRWNGRSEFGGNTMVIAKDGKMAAQYSGQQQEVWDKVRRHKEKMVGNNGLPESKTDSVNEELDNAKIQDRLKKFEEVLGSILEKHPHAVGMIFAVNGKFSTADVYGGKKLFRSLYPKLLRSAAYEAIAEKQGMYEPPTPADAKAFLAKSGEGKSREEKVRDTVATMTENDKTVRFDCRWKEAVLHTQAIEK